MKKIITLLLVLVMVVSMTCGAFAAQTGTNGSPALCMEITSDADVTEVAVYLQGAANVTNGSLSISYTADGAQLLSYEKTDAYSLSSINTRIAGNVGFSWVGSSLTASKTLLLTLRFQTTADTVVSVSAGSIYAGSSKLTVADDCATIEMPSAWSNPFTDIDKHWAKADILTVAEAGLFNGVTKTTFAPDEVMTRAMFVTVLYRASGAKATTSSTAFADVAANAYYAEAVAWAVEAGVTNGVSKTSFDPDATISRQEMMTMLYRYVTNVEGRNTSASADLSTFTDSAAVENWAKAAMSWAVAEGIIKGYPDGTLLPASNATRAEAATIFCRCFGL